MECILKNVDGRVYRVRPVATVCFQSFCIKNAYVIRIASLQRPDEAARPKTKPARVADVPGVPDVPAAPEDEPSCAASAHFEDINLEELVAEGIDECEDGKFHCAWKIPSCLVRFVVGRGGQTRNGIQRDCKVELVIAQKEDSRVRVMRCVAVLFDILCMRCHAFLARTYKVHHVYGYARSAAQS